jgi:nitroreductase
VIRNIADLIQERFGLPTEAGRTRPAEGALALLLSHRTQRRYKPDPIPDDVLEMALAAALSAPSKSDLQQVGIVLVKDRAKQSTVAGWIPDMPWIGQAPLFMVFCGDNRRIRRVSELRAKPFPNDTLDMFMNAAVDAGLVLQAFITAAEALGLGCCPISVVRNHVDAEGEPALRGSLRVRPTLRVVGGQSTAVLGAGAAQLRPVHPAPRLRPGLRPIYFGFSVRAGSPAFSPSPRHASTFRVVAKSTPPSM